MPLRQAQGGAYGEDYIYQRTNTWNVPYTFSGKEKDSETGYSYFGARYYDSNLSIWLSVDPLADDFPHQSPIMYCNGNPVIFVDPNGMAADWVERDGEIVYDKDVIKGEDGKVQNLKEGDKYLGKEGWDVKYHYRSDGTKAEYTTTLKEATIVGLRGSGPVVSAMEYAINKGYDPTWYPGFRRVVDAALTVIEFELAVVMLASALDDIAISAGVRGTSTPNGLGSFFRGGRTAKASELVGYAEQQGWKALQSAKGPLKYVDENGIIRMTIKQGSQLTPGSGSPHVEFRNAQGERIDPFGNKVTRSSLGNHTDIIYDL